MKYARHFARSLMAATGERDLYACPLCLKRFACSPETIDALTWDHFPPQSIGGLDRHAALVCAECREAWQFVDRQVAVRRDRERFDAEFPGMTPAVQRLIHPQKGDELYQRVALGITEERALRLVGRWENRQVTDLLDQLLEQGTYRELKFRLTFSSGPDPQPLFVERALLKAACLGVFSQLGYPYLLAPALEAVRRQLARPDATEFAGHAIKFSRQPHASGPGSTVPRDGSRHIQVACVTEPEAVAGVGVFFSGYDLAGWHAVFLPRPALGRAPAYGRLVPALRAANGFSFVTIDHDMTADSRAGLRDGSGGLWPIYAVEAESATA